MVDCVFVCMLECSGCGVLFVCWIVGVTHVVVD